MLKDEIQTALNEQIVAELYSGYLYLSMSAYFESLGLAGFASWMRVQAQEEASHVMMFFDFVNERRGRVKLGPIDGPPTEWESPLAVFEYGLLHEEKVSGLVGTLVDLAHKHSDHGTHNFLQWFVKEQVEEEASFDSVLQRLRLVGADGPGLFMIDREMAARTFTPPAPAA